MPHVKLDGDCVTFFENDGDQGVVWSPDEHELDLEVRAPTLSTKVGGFVSGASLDACSRSITGAAVVLGKTIAVFGPEGALTFPRLTVSLYQGLVPHAQEMDMHGRGYLAHWPGSVEPGMRYEERLSLALGLGPEAFDGLWSAVQATNADALKLTLRVPAYSGHISILDESHWRPVQSYGLTSDASVAFLRPRSKLVPELLQARLEATPTPDPTAAASMLDEHVSELALGAPKAAHRHRALGEAAHALARIPQEHGVLEVHLRRFADFLDGLQWSLDTDRSEAERDADEAERISRNIWQPYAVRELVQSKGVPTFTLDHSDVSNEAQVYLSSADKWASPTAERVLLHALIQTETLAFARNVLDTIFAQDFGLGGIAVYGAKFESSFNSYAKLRLRRAFQELGLFALAVVACGFLLASGGNSDSPGWMLPAGLILAFVLLARMAWLALRWAVGTLLRGGRGRKRLEVAALLDGMIKLADAFPQITSPHEAAGELRRLEEKGAKWPRNTWALVQGAIARGETYWGEPLTYR